MGNRLDGFDINLQFNEDGEVKVISYEDAEGCGREVDLDPAMTIDDVARIHLEHYEQSHHMKPRVVCPVRITADNKTLRCILTQHDESSRHLFEL